jgi:hypothetical protein
MKPLLAAYPGRSALLESYDSYSLPARSHNFLIIDGGTAKAVELCIPKLSDLQVIFIEGKRRPQRRAAMRALFHSGYAFELRLLRDEDGHISVGRVFVCRHEKNFLKRLGNYTAQRFSNWLTEARIRLAVLKHSKIFCR